MKTFKGKVLFLDRSDINTDEIIPARYLTEITKEALKPYLLEDLELEGFSAENDIKDKSVIISRDNFGCGSSREHAPWALEVNGLNAVIASGFARIFRQNMFNCGMLAIELDEKIIDDLFKKYAGKIPDIEIDIEKSEIIISADGMTERIQFNISEYDKVLVKSNGWVEYADSSY
ncbi:MAG: 3-isopropylmalate dehydratase small subunit [Spirochaetes bacterium]|nr:3-isopropylmalate dehydratase small subunit [Spirochaetota bacterium]